MNIISFLIYFSIAFFLAILAISLTKLLSNKKRILTTSYDVFESGAKFKEIFDKRHSVKFFNTLVVFLLLNINVLMLFPWAMIYQKRIDKSLLIGVFSFYTIILMTACLFIFFYRGLKKEKINDH